MNAREHDTGAIAALVIVVVFAVGVLVGGALQGHHRPAPRPAAPPPVEGRCDHGIMVWPGAGVFPVPECAQP
jgi:hypothetical protein